MIPGPAHDYPDAGRAELVTSAWTIPRLPYYSQSVCCCAADVCNASKRHLREHSCRRTSCRRRQIEAEHRTQEAEQVTQTHSLCSVTVNWQRKGVNLHHAPVSSAQIPGSESGPAWVPEVFLKVSETLTTKYIGIKRVNISKGHPGRRTPNC